MNEFSILCRVLGSLFYRQPQDPLLVPLYTLIREGKLAQNWPLEQDEMLERLQKNCDAQGLAADFNALLSATSAAFPRIAAHGWMGLRKPKCGHFSRLAVCR
jgi:TorA maturation chaperone TorD